MLPGNRRALARWFFSAPGAAETALVPVRAGDRRRRRESREEPDAEDDGGGIV
jgi:hypothetical protein